jgi:hypothetical protein
LAWCGLGDQARHKRRRTDRDVEGRGIAGAALLINERVHDDARIGRQAERGLIVEGDAERGIGPGHQRVMLKNRIVDAKRCDPSGIAAGDCRIALQRRLRRSPHRRRRERQDFARAPEDFARARQKAKASLRAMCRPQPTS